MNKQNGIVEIHGRQYETVALRVQKFRQAHPDHTLQTKVVRLDEEMVVIEAAILNEQGRLIANGHAQEFRQSSSINKTSYVENCETSAIGRALACFGLGGTEFATADELHNAINNKKPPHAAERPGDAKDIRNSATTGYWESLGVDMQNVMLDTAARVATLLKKGDTKGAVAELTEASLHFDGDAELAAAQWTRFESHERSALKAAGFKFTTTTKEAA
jgi:hypothetical protein